jgi:DNA-directed RNA polymerase specialized sigma24 family protein
MLPDFTPEEDYVTFEKLYESYAPKIYGFLCRCTSSKEERNSLTEKIFLRVWKEINYFKSDPERKILMIVLSICKPLFKKQKAKDILLSESR